MQICRFPEPRILLALALFGLVLVLGIVLVLLLMSVGTVVYLGVPFSDVKRAWDEEMEIAPPSSQRRCLTTTGSVNLMTDAHPPALNAIFSNLQDAN